MIVPYLTAWSAEQPLPATVIENRWSDIGYLDETLADRDQHGVLWQRVPSRPGVGRPEFGRVHPLRQRRAMRRLLCGVCAGTPDHTEQGTLWLIRDFRDDWPNWPEGMAATEPPVCLPCARKSIRLCPALRKGHVAVRVRHSDVAGVYGARYQAGSHFPRLSPTAWSASTIPRSVGPERPNWFVSFVAAASLTRGCGPAH